MTVIVLAMHGVPPKDFPGSELREFFTLQAAFGHGHETVPAQGQSASPDSRSERFAEVRDRMLSWPRTEANDPFYFGSQELAERLRRATGSAVIVGFNEFCAPDLDSALDQGAASGDDPVVVVTPMMTRGGDHSESDIPEAIARARLRHPKRKFVYAWPFEAETVSRFLAAQIARHTASF